VVAILILDVVPAVEKKRAEIVEADEEDFRTPAKSVSDMNWRSLAAGHFL
jgi:hypothetical protein